jgi:tetratricopeptide (TPR) repeat protein
MSGAIYLIIAGVAIGILTLIKPNFFWNHPKAMFARKYIGDKGTILLYLIISIAFISYGTFSTIKINRNKLLLEGDTLYQNGQLDEAESKLIKYTEYNPDNYVGWTILGHINLDKENYDKAIGCYDNAIKADSNAFEPYSGLGMVYSAIGNYEIALDFYLKANEIKPDQGTVIGNLANLYDNTGNLSKAIELGEKATELAPDNSILFANLSIYYNKNGEIEKRDRMFQKAKELGYSDLQLLLDIFENKDTLITD